MKYAYSLTLPLFALMMESAAAGTVKAERVVELFTSQGCSSCPPANDFVGTVAEDEATLVLSYGVTYWDYLGWKDTFAQPEFTNRQKAYAKAFGSGNVYTPQIVLNGSAHGSRYSKHDVHSMTLSAQTPDVDISFEAGGLRAKSTDTAPRIYAATLVEYVEGPQTVPVDSGENRGRVLTLTNVVTDVADLGRWNSEHVLSLETAPEDGKSYALLLQDYKTKKLISALRYVP